MITRWLDVLRGASSVAIPDALWEATLAGLPFLARLDPDERARLRELAGRLLADKQMAPAAGLELSAAMQVSIAAQASLPILQLGPDWYRGWVGIVVYPATFAVPRRVADDDGVVHEYTDELAGEAWHGGPVVLSWEDVERTPAPGAAPANVVIHEFTHQIDLLDGIADGCPPFDRRSHPTLDRAQWRATLEDALERLDAELSLIAAELPPGLDPDSDAADPYYAQLPLDPYAATDEGEFFAVSAEAFFVSPGRLRDAFPAWYAQLAEFFRQDPLAPPTDRARGPAPGAPPR